MRMIGDDYYEQKIGFKGERTVGKKKRGTACGWRTGARATGSRGEDITASAFLPPLIFLCWHQPLRISVFSYVSSFRFSKTDFLCNVMNHLYMQARCERRLRRREADRAAAGPARGRGPGHLLLGKCTWILL
jgi:hypothetical protein